MKGKADDLSCHYTTDDLICTGNGHRTFVIRQYKSILRIPDDTIRRRVWIDHTIALEIDDNKGSDRFSSIATDRSHVVLVSVGFPYEACVSIRVPKDSLADA